MVESFKVDLDDEDDFPFNLDNIAVSYNVYYVLVPVLNHSPIHPIHQIHENIVATNSDQDGKVRR